MCRGVLGIGRQNPFERRPRRVEPAQHAQRVAEAEQRLRVAGPAFQRGLEAAHCLAIAAEGQIGATEIGSDRAVLRRRGGGFRQKSCGLFRPVAPQTDQTKAVQASGVMRKDPAHRLILTLGRGKLACPVQGDRRFVSFPRGGEPLDFRFCCCHGLSKRI